MGITINNILGIRKKELILKYRREVIPNDDKEAYPLYQQIIYVYYKNVYLGEAFYNKFHTKVHLILSSDYFKDSLTAFPVDCILEGETELWFKLSPLRGSIRNEVSKHLTYNISKQIKNKVDKLSFPDFKKYSEIFQPYLHHHHRVHRLKKRSPPLQTQTQTQLLYE